MEMGILQHKNWIMQLENCSIYSLKRHEKREKSAEIYLPMSCLSKKHWRQKERYFFFMPENYLVPKIKNKNRQTKRQFRAVWPSSLSNHFFSLAYHSHKEADLP